MAERLHMTEGNAVDTPSNDKTYVYGRIRKTSMESSDYEKTMKDSRERSRNLEFRPGDVLLNNYRFVRELGSGAMGKVLLFEDMTIDGLMFAMKTVPYVMVGDEREEEMIKRECKAMFSLSHPGIVTVRTLIHDDFHYYLVMDYVDGVTLDAYLEDCPKPPLAVTLEVVHRMAEALDFAHGRDIIHRDVKPANVMVKINGGDVDTVKLLDFGLSSRIHETLGGMSQTDGMQLDSTPAYMAPELFQMKYGDMKADRFSAVVDQYALATVAYKMVAGALPFDGTNLFVLAYNVVTQPVPKIDGAPDYLNDALQKALSKNPADRFESCMAFATALSTAPSAPPLPPPPPRPVIKKQSSVPLVEKTKNMTIMLPGDVPLELVHIRAGSFMMGSPTDEPGRYDDEIQHRVTLTQDFWLGKYSVTQGQWKAIMGTTLIDQAEKAHPGEGKKWIFSIGGDYPLYYVNWLEAAEFCRALTEREQSAGRLPAGYKFILPTEAQWEYACRAGTSTALYNGDIVILGECDAPALDGIAWYTGNSSVGYEGQGWDTKDLKEKQYPGGFAGPRKVGGKKPNAWGLYDMIGNVCDWCRDWYGGYPSGSATDPAGPLSGSRRVLRGGSWYYYARNCRSAYRYNYVPRDRSSDIGFRVALAAVQ